MSFSTHPRSKQRQAARTSTVWAAAKERAAQGSFPVRIPPRGDLSRPYPTLQIEKRRAAYSESELHSAAAMLAKLKKGEDHRAELVCSVRDSLTREEYDSDLKLEIAADRLLDDLID